MIDWNSRDIHIPNGYLLPTNHRNLLPPRMIFFDTETFINPDKQTFRLGYAQSLKLDKINGHAYIQDKDLATNSLKQLVKFIFPQNGGTYIFCHNLSFDLRVIYPLLPQWVTDNISCFSLESGKSFLVVTPFTSNALKMIDTHNFFAGSVEQMGELFGLTKEGKDITFDDPNDSRFINNISDEELMGRCRQDVEIIKTSMVYLIDNFIRSETDPTTARIRMPMTLSSLSFSTYRNFYMQPYKIHIQNQSGMRKLERDAYHGGRVEIFRMGKIRNAAILDVNGMYAYVMEKFKYPTEAYASLKQATPQVIKGYIDNGSLVIADCLIKTNASIPPYPISHPVNSKLLFPSGEFVATLCTPEIQIALERGELLEAKNIILYHADHIFKRFVQDISAKKEQAKIDGNELMHFFYKLVGNSLYGKFGQRIEKLVKLCEIQPDHPELYDIEDFMREHDLLEMVYQMDVPRRIQKLFQHYWISMGKGEGYYSIPSVAAHITAQARSHLWRLLMMVDDPIYVDTDSLTIRSQELPKLKSMIHPSKLGMMDIEYCNVDFQATEPKVYSFTEEDGTTHHKRKGVPKKAKQTGERTFEYDHILGFKEALKIHGEPVIVTEKRTKVLKSEYDKRAILPDGATLPHDISTLFEGA